MSVLIDQRPPAVDERRERRATGWLTLGLVLGPLGLAIGWYYVHLVVPSEEPGDIQADPDASTPVCGRDASGSVAVSAAYD